jgi:hypothetical protein
VWEYGVRQWQKTDAETQKNDRFIMEQLTTHLAKLEEDAGNLPRAIEWFEAAKAVANPEVIQKQINRLKYKLGQEFNPLLKPLY